MFVSILFGKIYLNLIWKWYFFFFFDNKKIKSNDENFRELIYGWFSIIFPRQFQRHFPNIIITFSKLNYLTFFLITTYYYYYYYYCLIAFLITIFYLYNYFIPFLTHQHKYEKEQINMCLFMFMIFILIIIKFDIEINNDELLILIIWKYNKKENCHWVVRDKKGAQVIRIGYSEI